MNGTNATYMLAETILAREKNPEQNVCYFRKVL